MEPRMLTAEECRVLHDLYRLVERREDTCEVAALLTEVKERLASLEPDRLTYNMETGKVTRDTPLPSGEAGQPASPTT